MRAAPSGAREQAFEAARMATAQRAARSLAMLDTAAVGKAAGNAPATRRVGDLVFTLRDGTWVDGRWREGMRTIRVRLFSDAYFRVLELAPALRAALALGDRVLVAGQHVAIEVSPTGAQTLSAAELAALGNEW